ncbi:MAG: ATP-binding protein [Bacteroidota bacterium]
MVQRLIQQELTKRIGSVPVVALLGPRQVGKTTLAKSVKVDKPLVYIDLERSSDLAKLEDPELFLTAHKGSLVVLDEIQRLPNLFPLLRSLVDERREQGERAGHFLILGSATPELLRQGSETLAGRISYFELSPFQLRELGKVPDDGINKHWFRGGFPESYLSDSDEIAMQWCDDFLTAYVERYIPQLGVMATPQQLRRFCTMLAHQQSATVNFTKLGNALGLDSKTVRTYIELLEGLYLIRKIPAWSTNVGKRLVKAAKFQWRDSGLVHALLGLGSLDQVTGHPICGHSWEGYCTEQILNALPKGVVASHYRTHAGAEVDLVLSFPDGRTHAIEIKRTLSPKITPSLLESIDTITADRASIIMPAGTSYALSSTIDAMSLHDVLRRDWS